MLKKQAAGFEAPDLLFHTAGIGRVHHIFDKRRIFKRPAAHGVMEFANIRILYIFLAAGILLLQGVTHFIKSKGGEYAHAKG